MRSSAGRICRAQILAPQGQSYGACFTRLPRKTIEFVPAEYLDRTRPTTVNSGSPVRDPTSGQSYRRYDLHYRLASPSGEPSTEAPPPRPRMTAGRHRRRPPLPPDRTAACRAGVDRLQAQLTGLESRLDELTQSEEAFEINEPNPELVAEVIAELSRVTGLPGDPFPLVVECRGPVCSVTPRDPTDTKMKIAWTCDTGEGRERCFVDRTSDGWYSRLHRAEFRNALFARVDLARGVTHAQATGPAYVRVRPVADRAKADPFAVLCELEARVEASGVLQACERRFPGAGLLTLKLSVPGPDTPAGSERHIGIEDAGDLAGTPLGSCIVQALRAAAATHEIPETRNGLVANPKIQAPGVMRTWSARCKPTAPTSP